MTCKIKHIMEKNLKKLTTFHILYVDLLFTSFVHTYMYEIRENKANFINNLMVFIPIFLKNLLNNY